jgi:hypothetical protein
MSPTDPVPEFAFETTESSFIAVNLKSALSCAMFADVARMPDSVESIFAESMPDVARRNDACVIES